MAEPAEIARLKDQRTGILDMVRQLRGEAYNRLCGSGGRFQEGATSYLMIAERRIEIMIKTGKRTIDEANEEARRRNPEWKDV